MFIHLSTIASVKPTLNLILKIDFCREPTPASHKTPKKFTTPKEDNFYKTYRRKLQNIDLIVANKISQTTNIIRLFWVLKIAIFFICLTYLNYKLKKKYSICISFKKGLDIQFIESICVIKFHSVLM